MGAVALSKQDETILESLKKELHLLSKSEVLRRALRGLQQTVVRDRLAREIRQSVARCSKADHEEHKALIGTALKRLQKE